MPADSEYESVGNRCLLGQIASFMEQLGLSYDEVTKQIPYRNLIIMQKDKLHSVNKKYLPKEVTEAELGIVFDG